MKQALCSRDQSIFALIALLPELRLIYGWNVTIGQWTVPVWVSAAGVQPGWDSRVPGPAAIQSHNNSRASERRLTG
jgi:hypothetical protein